MEVFKAMDELHLKSGAEFKSYENDATMVMSYAGRLKEEVNLLRTACGVYDLKACWLISLKGAEAGVFLQGMVTMDVVKMRSGEVEHGLICMHKGKIQHHVEILKRAEDEWIVMCDPGEGRQAGTMLDQFHVREDLEMRLLNSEMVRVDLIGPGAKVLLKNKGYDSPKKEWSVDGEAIYCTLFPAVKVERFVNLVPLNLLESFYKMVLEEEGTGLISSDAFDELRVLNGIPRMHQDYGSNNFPQEAALGDHISYNKGCYVGQEPHSRMLHRGHPNWMLVWVRIPESENISSGMKLYQQAEEKGEITSIGRIASDGYFFGIAMVRFEVSQQRSPLSTSPEAEPVVELNFLPNTIGLK